MDGTYAPQSPDLSSFLSSPTKTQQPYQPQSTSYTPRSPVLPSFNSNPQAHQPLHNQYQQQQQQQQQQQHLHAPHQRPTSGDAGEFSEYGANSYMPPIPALPSAHYSFGAAPQLSPQYYQQPPIKPEDSYEYKPAPFDGASDGSDYAPTMSRAPRQTSSTLPQSSSFNPAPTQFNPPAYKNPNPNNIEIRTKFPVARIKRIMQADEEVGKVAQVTPVAVSKALELFMIALVSGAADKAREKGGKRVTAQHLKMVVEGDEQFDFLSEIVGKVADVQEGAGGHKRKSKVEENSDSDEEPKKKGKGRRKKGDD